MAEIAVPVRPADRNSDTNSEPEQYVVGDDDLDLLFPATLALPDGRVVPIEALVAAIASGDSSVPGTDGADIPIIDILDLLTKDFAKTSTDGDETLAESNGQASFRDGMDMVMLGSLHESGRIGFSEPSSTEPRIGRRGKEKPVDKEELREILIDGPDAGDDIIRPAFGGAEGEDFIERLQNNKTPDPIFSTAHASGNLIDNDTPGTNGFGEIVSVEYNGTIYYPTGTQIVIDEPGVWRLTVNLSGTPGDPETGYGLYFFEQVGPLDHSTARNGDIASFELIYTIADSTGSDDTGSIRFQIVDSNPVAEDDIVTTIENQISYGRVLSNDIIGADGPGRILGFGIEGETLTADDADADGRVTLEGAFGTVVFDFDDGAYEYYSGTDALGGDAESVIDEFYYVIGDADGDEDTGHLIVEILPGGLKEGPVIEGDGSGEGDIRTEGINYEWSDFSQIDVDRDRNVDGAKVIKGFMPDIDRLDVDGLLESLGFDDAKAASGIFRVIGSENGADLQVDLGNGWQTFASVSNSPPLTLDEVEAAIVS